jgi:hypothetical protein
MGQSPPHIITVGMVVGVIASGCSRERILQAYPQLEPADIDQALALSSIPLLTSAGHGHQGLRSTEMMQNGPHLPRSFRDRLTRAS